MAAQQGKECPYSSKSPFYQSISFGNDKASQEGMVFQAEAASGLPNELAARLLSGSHDGSLTFCNILGE
jgi:hypothetical protein